MSQPKAFQILASLNDDELSRFDKFIASPFFNTSNELISLFKTVRKYYPEFDNPALEPEKIYKKLYPKRQYKEGTIRNLLSELSALSEKFLAFVNYETSFEYGSKLLGEINNRGLNKFFNKNYQKFCKDNEESTEVFAQKLINEFFLQHAYSISIKNDYNEETLRAIYSRAETLLCFLLVEFLMDEIGAKSLERSYRMVIDNNIVQKFLESSDISGLISVLKRNKNPHAERMEFYYLLNLAASNKDGKTNENFEKCYDMFKKIQKKTSFIEQRRLYVLLLNVIKLNITTDNLYLSKRLFELTKEMVEKGLTSDARGEIHNVEFSNAILTAINVKETEWAAWFLESKRDKLDPEIRADFYYFYKARIIFEEKKYIESNELLSKISKDSILFKMDAKVLKMMNYYELNYTESAFSQAETFRQFLSYSDKISDNRKELNVNFLKFFLKLLRIKSEDSKDDITLLKKEISECGMLRNKSWLIDKADELAAIKSRIQKRA